MTERCVSLKRDGFTAVAEASRRADLSPGDRQAVVDFASWLISRQPTYDRQACWTQIGLDYMGVDATYAREKGLEGWQDR